MHKCHKDELFVEENKLSWFDGLKSWQFQEIDFCPICGMCFQPERLNPEDAILPAFFGNKFCAGCKEENCVCDSPNSTNK